MFKVLLEVEIKDLKEVLEAVALMEYKDLKVMLVYKVLLVAVHKDLKEVLEAVVLMEYKDLKVM